MIRELLRQWQVKIREVLKIARRVYVLRTGQISFAGPAAALGDDAKLREVYL